MFSRALELRFVPSTYKNHHAQLCKLRQHCPISEYQANFEKLRNRVIGIQPNALLNCFILRSIPSIRNELDIQCPNSISQILGLAELKDSILNLPDLQIKSITPQMPNNITQNHYTLSQTLQHYLNR